MSKQTDSFYNRFSFLYPIVDVFLRPQKKRLYKEVNNQPYGKLLEIGVGNGSHLRYYKTHKVIGIDSSEGMLEIAHKHKKKDTELLLMNAENLVFGDGEFDYVVLSHVIAVVDDPEKLLLEVHRVLKPNGKLFILNHFTPENGLKHVDRAFGNVTNKLHFKSVFFIDGLKTLRNFTLIKEVKCGPMSYFKLLIYTKP